MTVYIQRYCAVTGIVTVECVIALGSSLLLTCFSTCALFCCKGQNARILISYVKVTTVHNRKEQIFVKKDVKVMHRDGYSMFEKDTSFFSRSDVFHIEFCLGF